ncbi:MAG: DUF1521 domain-containing protein [Comamonadaceae bacterium]|nr:DUF1521 domain-containing protein [Comamonadaceae bacterium]
MMMNPLLTSAHRMTFGSAGLGGAAPVAAGLTGLTGMRAEFHLGVFHTHLVQAGINKGAAFQPAQPDAKWTVSNPGNGKASVDLGKYELQMDEGNSQIKIVNKNNGEVTNIWGDPHIDWNKDGKTDADFWGKTTFQLEDGTKITIGTEPWKGNKGMYVASEVTVTRGDHALQIKGLSQNELGDMKIEYADRGGQALDWAVTDGFVVKENAQGEGWINADTGKLATQKDFDITKPGAPKIHEFTQAFGQALGLYLSTGMVSAITNALTTALARHGDSLKALLGQKGAAPAPAQMAAQTPAAAKAPPPSAAPAAATPAKMAAAPTAAPAKPAAVAAPQTTAPVGAVKKMPAQMKMSQAGLNMVKKYEGLYTKAYYCPAGVLTIGYGHTGPDVKPGQRITAAQAENLLRKDMAQFENAVKRLVKVPLTQGQFDALVSFSFNVGAGALGKSTLLKKLNAGDYAGAQAEFKRWNKGGGRVLPGLVKRRAEEAQMFGSAGPRAQAPAAQPAHAAQAAAPAALPSKGMPDTRGMSAQQKFNVYAAYINKHGDAQAKKDLAAGKAVVLALRQDTPMTKNMPRHGVYDDRIVVLRKTAKGPQVTEMAGNTEPNRRWAEPANASGKPVGRLTDGQTIRYYKSHSGKFGNHLRPYGSPLVQRDMNRNYKFDPNEKSYTGKWGGQTMLIHRGGKNNTGSQGCQTMAQAEFNRFWNALGSQKNVSYVLVKANR